MEKKFGAVVADTTRSTHRHTEPAQHTREVVCSAVKKHAGGAHRLVVAAEEKVFVNFKHA